MNHELRVRRAELGIFAAGGFTQRRFEAADLDLAERRMLERCPRHEAVHFLASIHCRSGGRSPRDVGVGSGSGTGGHAAPAPRPAPRWPPNAPPAVMPAARQRLSLPGRRRRHAAGLEPPGSPSRRGERGHAELEIAYSKNAPAGVRTTPVDRSRSTPVLRADRIEVLQVGGVHRRRRLDPAPRARGLRACAPRPPGTPSSPNMNMPPPPGRTPVRAPRDRHHATRRAGALARRRTRQG